jgi:serine/threonine protein kinase
MAALIGQQLGNYRIEERLGVGGMGEVYRAIHVHLNRPAAIKVLHSSQAADSSFQARFLREARAAAALSHPNIVEVFDFGEQDGVSYLVMELIPDGSLQRLLRQRSAEKGWTLGLGVDLVRQAAEGLAYAHVHHMVHRDIKPDNLLLQRLDSPDQPDEHEIAESYHLKISDFGLARLIDESGDLTATGMVMGTPTYMSPEQCQGADLDGRSDLYSLGVVLYEVATGSPPFRARTLSEAVFKHISEAPPRPRTIQPNLPSALEDVILRCLAKKPADRFATGTELSAALADVLGSTDEQTIVSRFTPPQGVPFPLVAAGSAASGSGASSEAAPSAEEEPLARTVDATPLKLSALSVSEDQAAEPVTTAPPLEPPSQVDSRPQVDPRRVMMASIAQSLRSRYTPPPAMPDRSYWTSSATDLRRPDLRNSLMAVGATSLVLLALVMGLFFSGLRQPAATAVARRAPTGQATSTATAAPAPTAADVVTFQDTMSAPSSQWPRSARANFGNGGYEINGAWLVLAPASALKDGTVSVRLKQLGGVTDQFYGLVVREQNNGSYYVLGISGDQRWTFMLVKNGGHTALVSPTVDTHINRGPNTANDIAVRMRGSQFTFYANGTEIGQADDAVYGSGKMGIVNIVGRLDVVYNDFKVAVPA